MQKVQKIGSHGYVSGIKQGVALLTFNIHTTQNDSIEKSNAYFIEGCFRFDNRF